MRVRLFVACVTIYLTRTIGQRLIAAGSFPGKYLFHQKGAQDRNICQNAGFSPGNRIDERSATARQRIYHRAIKAGSFDCSIPRDRVRYPAAVVADKTLLVHATPDPFNRLNKTQNRMTP